MRIVAKVLRAAFRLLLAILVIYAVVGGVFWWSHFELALTIGIALAILCDRIWMRIRGLGPELIEEP